MKEQIQIMVDDYRKNIQPFLIINRVIEYTNSCLVSLVKINKQLISKFKTKYNNLIQRDVQIFWMYEKSDAEIIEKMICSECLQKTTKFINIISGFSRCCCAKCSQSSEQTRIKRKKTNDLKTEDEKQQIVEKTKNTCLEKYGVDNPFKCREIQQKIEDICLEKYGTKKACQSDIIKDRIKQTMLDKYKQTSYTQTVEYKNIMKEYYLSENYLKRIHSSDDETKIICGKIYKITNMINGKIYIGQTTRNIQQRFNEHAQYNSKYQSLIQKAIHKYGKENFIIDEVDFASTYKELNQKERDWVIKENCIAPNGYNLCLGGYNKGLSYKSKEKMSKSHLNKVSNIKGCKHYFNIKTGEHKLFKIDDVIPDDFIQGNPSTKGKYFIDENGMKKLKKDNI